MSHLGYYGKIPHRGDFVRFNLPQLFITVWDDWLQQLMAFGKAQHPDWSDQFSQAPDVRFIISSGIAGNTAWTGLMKPSSDKVGRQFPFTLAMSLPAGSHPVQDMHTLDNWFEHAQRLLDKACSAHYDFNELQEELGQFGNAVAIDTATAPAEQQALCPELLSLSLHGASANLSQPAALSSLLDSVLAQTISEYSLWTSTRQRNPELLLHAGLPVNHAALALFNGQWQHTQMLTSVPVAEQAAAEPLESDPADTHTRLTEAPSTDTRVPPLRPDHAPGFSRASDAHTADSRALEQDNTSAPTHSDEMEHSPSPDDWAVLDKYEPAEQEDAVVLPPVEPLELDDDESPDAPWEK